MRPWKAEQLGGGYAVSSFAERTGLEGADAVIAVSAGMRSDLLRCYPAIEPERVCVIHNGIDTDEYRPDSETGALEHYGIDPQRPTVVFVGRITRQKGLGHLLDAAELIDPSAQLVLAAGSPDTPEIAAETAAQIERLGRTRDGVTWLPDRLSRPELIQILSHASVFVCPSVYEPLGIVNLEAMACEAAVVASAVGGIPEIVVDGETGYLVPCDPEAVASDETAARLFEATLAERINQLVADPDLATRLGTAGRRRVLDRFTWEQVALRTVEVYRQALAAHAAG
jgi:starch synthase